MRSNWQSAPIQDLVEKIETYDPRKKPMENFRYIDVSSVSRSRSTVSEAAVLSGRDAPSRARRFVRAGDVIFATIRPTLNRIALISDELDGSVCSTGFFVLRPKHNVLSQYLFYWLLGERFTSEMERLQRGASYPAVSDGHVREQIVDVPPIPEQKRIVSFLDEAFSGTDAAIAKTEKNLANARELFESYLNSIVPRSSANARERPLLEFSESISTGPFGSLLHKSDYVSDGVPLVNPINIVKDKVVPDHKKMIGDNTKEKLGSYILCKGDVVIARRGEIGRCAVIDDDQDGWVCGTGCFFIRPSSSVNPHYLAHLLRSPRYRMELERLSSGATMLNLSNKALSGLYVSIPSITVQREIVEQVSDVNTQCRNIELIYQKKLNALAELKQSLLQKAFSGELTDELAEKEMDEAVA